MPTVCGAIIQQRTDIQKHEVVITNVAVMKDE